MKKFTIGLFLLAFLSASAAYAEQTSVDHFSQAGITYDHSHTVDTTTSFGAGIGADIVIYKTDSPLLREVVIENRYDIDNSEYRVYAVAKVDLFDAIKNR